MFNHIMAPVDLAHKERLERALKVTADVAKDYGAKVTYVSASNATPGSIARTPEEFRERLAAFAREQGEKAGIETGSHPLILHDEAVDLDNALLHAVDELDADLVIMASHKPGFVDHFWSSNGGTVASRASASVFIVRED
jgi:nucleotide-binding universal stress UspA family protein